jgi:hypothetical protein
LVSRPYFQFSVGFNDSQEDLKSPRGQAAGVEVVGYYPPRAGLRHSHSREAQLLLPKNFSRWCYNPRETIGRRGAGLGQQLKKGRHQQHQPGQMTQHKKELTWRKMPLQRP